MFIKAKVVVKYQDLGTPTEAGACLVVTVSIDFSKEQNTSKIIDLISGERTLQLSC